LRAAGCFARKPRRAVPRADAAYNNALNAPHSRVTRLAVASRSPRGARALALRYADKN
jgi:hypothetical protein